ncbi:glycerophosphodiester phosphodiesterase family protein [Leuconostoc mesenteroides]
MKKIKLNTLFKWAVALFIYNLVAKIIIYFAQKTLPDFYRVDTSSITSLTDSASKYLGSLLGIIAVYIVLWFMFAGIVLYFLRRSWGEKSEKHFTRQLLSYKLHASIALFMILMIPLVQIGLKVPFAQYLALPKTFVDMVSGFWANIIFTACYLVLVVLLVKFRHISYFAISQDYSLLDAIKMSARESMVSAVQLFLKSIIRLVVASGICFALLYLVQLLADNVFDVNTRRFIANILLATTSALMYVITAYILNLYVTLLTIDPKKDTGTTLRGSSILLQGLMLVVIGAGSTLISGSYFISPREKYLVIAHKGVSYPNAVPNSLIALKKTIATHPDYIEIDIQPTKDGVYVLTHNTKIKTVSGETVDISKTNWSTLKTKKVIEDGHQFYLTSFSKYIDLANQKKQKLLVELKLNQTITDKQLKQFVNKYGKKMKENKSEIQSMNQNVIKRIHQYTSLTTGLLSPVKNTIDGNKISQFYAIEYSKVDAHLSSQIRNHNKDLYSWTVNDRFDVETAYMIGVDGVITDKPRETRQILKNVSEELTYRRAFISMILNQQSDI